jgi:FkbH-like protein
MVFLDDNPFEREMIKSGIPEIEVPDLPDDPVEFLPYLQSQNLFETASFLQDDAKRTLFYQEEAERISYQKIYQDEDEYLEQLEMIAECIDLNSFTIPRAAQLSQRCNQFNLRTVRYSEEELKKITTSEDYISLIVCLKDRFGDYGIICFIVLKKITSDTLFIDSWLMSCRVLKRTVENFVLNKIIDIATSNGYKRILGEYLPTAKNRLVKDHYEKLGFRSEDQLWVLDTSGNPKKKTLITDSSYALLPRQSLIVTS